MTNPRFLLRLVTGSAVYLLAASCFGVVLWVVDEFLGWDILPDAWSMLVRALLVAGGVVAFVLVLMNLILSLSLLAEASASRAQLPDFQFSPRWRRRFRRSMVAGLAAVVLLVAGLQVTNQVRTQVAAQAAQSEFETIQAALDQALPEVLSLFTEPLTDAIAQETLDDQSRLFELRRLFDSVRTSFAYNPEMTLVLPAAAPYRYQSIGPGSIAANESRLFLSPTFYASFPTEQETTAIEALFRSEQTDISGVLTGSILNNTVPSTWGILKQAERVIGVVYLRSDSALSPAPRPHGGPEKLIISQG